jgi:predicted phage terminase large subunit-like protein
VGNRVWGSQYQGTPRPEEGQILDSSLLIRVDADQVPPLKKIVRRWDLAFSERQGADYVAGVKMGITDDERRYILHVKRIHGRWTASKRKIVDQALDDGIEVECLIEANGTQLGYYQDIKDDPRMAERVVKPDVPEGSKEMRASVWGSRLEDRILYVVRGEWNGELFDEMDAFPNGENDDVIDGVSGGWANLSPKPAQQSKSSAPKVVKVVL